MITVGQRETLAFWLNILAAVSAFAAAFCWGMATLAKPVTDQTVMVYGAESGKQYDIVATLASQTQWNRAGAFFAGFASCSQAVALLI